MKLREFKKFCFENGCTEVYLEKRSYSPSSLFGDSKMLVVHGGNDFSIFIHCYKTKSDKRNARIYRTTVKYYDQDARKTVEAKTLGIPGYEFSEEITKILNEMINIMK